MSSACLSLVRPPSRPARVSGAHVRAVFALVLMSSGLLKSAEVHAAARAGAPSTTPAGALAADPIVKARAAFQRRDRSTLAALRKSTAAQAHPLAMWVDYWDLSLRLRDARQADLEAFYARWPGTAVEDLLRKDWIAERGKAGDTAVLALELPRLRRAVIDTADDREAQCHALAQRHAQGEDVSGQAHELWFAQREADHGCAQLAATLFRAGHFTRQDVWARARLAAEQSRRYVAQHAIALLGTVKAEQVHQAFLQPARFLARRTPKPTPDEAELTALAVIRLAARSAPNAAAALNDPRATPLPAHAAAAAWAVVAKEGAIGQRPQAFEWFQRASSAAGGAPIPATPDTLAWQVRTALRALGQVSPTQRPEQAWRVVVDAVDAMGAAQRTDPTWTYWKARAMQALAEPGPQGDAQRRTAHLLLEGIATRLHYYGGLAAHALGREPHLPKLPPALTESDLARAQNHAGLKRGLALIALRLRDEGRFEWHHALAGMDDRALRAAAQLACDAHVWNLCMSTSELTRDEIDMAQRFPMPFRDEVSAAAREADIDAARLYAVIRQESNFSVGARSIAGAAGLMQLMPQTARWIAGRFRIPYNRERIFEPATNVRIGARYLKLVLSHFEGSHALAAAAYNAGPSRPRRWSKGGIDDAAVWTEIIPFNETRDYVKNVLANGASYGALLRTANVPALRASEEVDAPALRGAEASAGSAMGSQKSARNSMVSESSARGHNDADAPPTLEQLLAETEEKPEP
jgi:soluble lytic murein transglycosylase